MIPMKSFSKLAFIFTIIIVSGCIKQERSDTTSIQPTVPMNVGDIKEFTANNLAVIFKKTLGDTIELSLLLLRVDEKEDSTNGDLEELILRVSLRNVQNYTTVHMTNLGGFNALTIQSTTAQFEVSLNNLLSVFYNLSFDSLLIDSVRIGRFNSLAKASDEDLQRYHADKFVTSRLLLLIEGDFSYQNVKSAIEKSFYGKTVGEYKGKMLIYPVNPFISNIRTGEINSDSTEHKRKSQ